MNLGFFHLHFDTLFASTDHCPRLTPIYEKWCSPKSCKLQNAKITLRQGKSQSVSTHIPVITPIDHCIAVHVSVQICAGYSTLLITELCLGQFSKGYFIAACMAMICLIIMKIFFICKFSDCVICHSSVSNMHKLWSVEDNKVSKCRWNNSPGTIPQRSVLIMLPYNNRIEILTPYMSVDFCSLRCVYLVLVWLLHLSILTLKCIINISFSFVTPLI